ncbi:hypothetical protein Pan110_39960 [Gimesia panareensis]|nr:hypothetical protein Pan110_39960 [Gimesia panareensis]
MQKLKGNKKKDKKGSGLITKRDLPPLLLRPLYCFMNFL